MGRTEDDFTRPHGWTNFTMCFTQEVIDMMTKLTNGSLVVSINVQKKKKNEAFSPESVNTSFLVQLLPHALIAPLQ